MTVLLQHLWPALAASFAWGLTVAAVFGPGATLPSARRPVRVAAALLLGGAALLAWSEAVPGRPGLWLDIAVLCAAAYAGGVLAGTGVRRVKPRQPLPLSGAPDSRARD